MKRHALIHVEKPKSKDIHDPKEWRDFVASLDRKEVRYGSKHNLGEGNWLIPVESDLSLLATLIYLAEENHLTYSVRWFSSED